MARDLWYSWSMNQYLKYIYTLLGSRRSILGYRLIRLGPFPYEFPWALGILGDISSRVMYVVASSKRYWSGLFGDSPREGVDDLNQSVRQQAFYDGWRAGSLRPAMVGTASR